MRNRARVEVWQLTSAAGALAAVFALQAAAQTVVGVTEKVQITSGMPRAASDEFGVSVSISGTTAIVGAPGREGFFLNSGAAYIYTLGDSGWGDEVVLQPDAGNTTRFGSSVAVSGDVAVVGSPLHDFNISANCGAAYIYRRVGGAWQPPQHLLPPSPGSNNNFGAAVATSGDLVLVGEIAGDGPAGNCGLVHVYRDTGGSFVLEATLAATDPGSFDQFGAALAVEGETIVVGAPFRNNAGAAYVFQNSGSPGSPSWSSAGPMTPVGIAAGDLFGFSVSIDGTRAAVGAPQADVNAVVDTGTAYIIDAVTTSPAITTTLTAPGGGGPNDYFGYSVSIWDTRVLVGAYSSNPNSTIEAGEVHVFNFDGSAWNEDTILRAADASASDFFGYSVSAEQHAVLGAFRDDGIRGSAYLYDLGPTAPPDADGDGLTNAEELLLGTDPDSADSDGDTLTDGAEVLVHGTNPLSPDSDGDTLGDAAEIGTHGTNPNSTDSDADGLNDAAEVNVHATDPLDPDSDFDGLNDGAEITVGTNPLDADHDDDGLVDGDEISLGSNPFLPDTDGDGLTDGFEADNAQMGCTSPTNPDSDGDGLSDGFEMSLYPLLDPCDGDADADDDGLPNSLEDDFGTDPLNADTDGDGLTDGAEVDAAGNGTCPNPLLADSDGDTLSDGQEANLGTSACSADSDGDGAADNIDTTPNDPGVEPDVIRAWLDTTSDEVMAFDVELFTGPNNNVAALRQFMSAITLRAAGIAADRGRTRLAILELQLLRRRFDGGSPPADWMDASPEKDGLVADIDAAIGWLQIED